MRTVEFEGGRLFHNGDWSGEVIVALDDKPEVRLPGVVFRAAASKLASDAIVAEAENIADRVWSRIRGGKGTPPTAS